MKKIVILIRKVAKSPLVLLIVVTSHLQRFTLHEKWWVPLKLQHLFGFYEIETTKYFKKNIKRGMVVVDVGANVGYYTRLFSRLVGKNGKVYAFEPDQENFQILQKNTSHIPNITTFPFAVSDVDGEASFYHTPNATSVHSLRAVENAVETKVKTVRLDTIIPEKIDYVKIDVEWAETEVVRGMKAHMATSPWVVFEHTVGGLTDKLVEELQKSGQLFALSPKGEHIPYAEVVYTPNNEHPFAMLAYHGKAPNI